MTRRDLIATADRLLQSASSEGFVPFDADRLRDWIEAHCPNASASDLDALTVLMVQKGPWQQ